MCGIVGIFNYRNHHQVEEDIIRRMINSIAHRGPDGSNVNVVGNIGFGFTRLALIDFDGGMQPMRSQSGRFLLVFNGEIYNYREIRLELERSGYIFRTNSDTEVILALYEMGNFEPEHKLHGMFAFALYDSELKKLILSRDRLGKKPLFYADTSDGIVFGSEIKSILCAPGIRRIPNWPLIADFLTLSYCPGLETAFEGVFHVPPGGRIVITHEIDCQIWWKLPSMPEHEKMNSSNWEGDVLEALKKSIKYRLISDAPLGIFLSGGIDSALILSIISEEGFPRAFTSYTASFDSATFDETQAARSLAESFGVKHISVPVDPSSFVRIFRDVVFKSDNLIANPAIFPNYLLSEVAQNDVKAVFHGGGGDEIFFGYETYRADALSEKLDFLPKSLIRGMEHLIKPFPTTYQKLGFKYKATKFLEGMHYPAHKRHFWWRTIITESEKDQLFCRPVLRHDSYKSYKESYSRFCGDDFYEEVAFADMEVWWRCMGLYQGDAMSMANSLELRMPFMDQDLIGLMSNIPREIKFKNNLKELLKRVCQDYLPKYILNRPKGGFHVPLGEWFAGPLNGFLKEQLSPERLSNLPELNMTYIKKLIDDHQSRRFDNSFKLINLMILVEWHKRFFVDSHNGYDLGT